MLKRTAPLRDPVTFTLDGEPIPAERGEPIAVALVATGMVTLARSPKLHRPRAPTCFRGACDGCLARVDGEPNVMTCLRPARGGERVESQNTIGTREADLLRVTDWFFPKGIDHHHLMAGIPLASDLMLTFARKMAGLGKIPDRPAPPQAARRLHADVVIVGAGLAGARVAARLADRGLSIVVADDGVTPGGSAAFVRELASQIPEISASDRVVLLPSAVVAGVYEGEALIAAEAGAILVRPTAFVFATGAHDGILAIPHNDLPGIFSARALMGLAARGVVPSGRTVIAGDGFWANALARAAGPRIAERIAASDITNVSGSSRVKRVEVRDGSKTRRIDADILAVDVPGAPAFELAQQAGAAVHFDPTSGYAVTADARGRAGPHLWAVGEVTGIPFDPGQILRQADAAADDIASAIRG